MSDKKTVNKELERAEKQFEKFEENIKELTLDRMNEAPKEIVEQQTKLSQNQIANAKDLYLKPVKSITDKAKFNEKYREDWNFAKEFVYFIAEHREIIGEKIEMWTHPFAGVPFEYWEIPTNKPVWAPRHVAEQIKKASYHRLRTEDKVVNSDSFGAYTGAMVVDSTVQRLDAIPASKKKTIFMGASGF